MDKKELSPTEVYSFLPKTNCGKCSESTCLTFAIKVVNRDVPLEKCSPLLTKANSKAYSQLEELLKPVVMEVVVGVGAKAVRIGGKHVMYRHEFVLFNPTAIAIDVTDTLSDVELLTRVKQVEQFSFDYIGQSLKLDMIAVRSVSNDPEKFKATARKVAENTTLPLILCSLNSRILEAGLTAVSTSRPLLYAATKTNWQEVATLALRHDCPLVVHALNDLKLLRALVRKLLDLGVRDLVLDSGTFFGDGLAETLNNFTVIRRSACKRGDKLFGFPLLGIPLVAWLTHETHENIRK